MRSTTRAVALVVASAVALAACGSSGSGDDGEGPTSTTQGSQAESPSSTSPPSSVAVGTTVPMFDDGGSGAYEVTYRVERFRAGAVAIDTEVVRSADPFTVHASLRPGEPDASPISAPAAATEELEVLGGTESGSEGSTDESRILFAVAPGPAGRGIRVEADLSAAIERGLAEIAGIERSILGTRCTVVRVGAGSGDGAALVPLEPEDGVELCIDRRGLILQRIDRADDEIVSRRTAVLVDDSPAFDVGAFTPAGRRLPDAQGGGRVRRVTPDSRPPEVSHHELRSNPVGFDLVGRFGVATDSTTDPSASVDRIVSIVDVYRRGADVIAVENGGTESGRAYFASGLPVEVPDLPGASLLLRLTGTEIRATFDEGRFVRIVGTVSLAELLEVAASLRVVSGPGAVVPFDDDEDVAIP